MEPHNQPDYEETFKRVATILDVMAQEQLTTERALQAYIAEGRETTDRLNGLIELFKVRDAETTDKLNGVIQLLDRDLREQSGN